MDKIIVQCTAESGKGGIVERKREVEKGCEGEGEGEKSRGRGREKENGERSQEEKREHDE